MSTIPPPKKLDFSNSPPLSKFTPTSKSICRKPDDILKQQLATRAQKYISNGMRYQYKCFQLDIEESDGRISEHISSMLMVPAYTETLFEGRYIKEINDRIAHYLFRHVIGYDDYFDCLCIIIRDEQGNVVDIVKYRPHRQGYDHLPKYLYLKAEDKPKDRGEFFLYPFQVEMERLIKKEDFLFVGEGLKNSVNALIRSVPFLSIESASNAENPEIIIYVNELMEKGIPVYAVMDGDSAGEKALRMLNKKLDRPLINLIDFDSNTDFTEYLRKEFIWE